MQNKRLQDMTLEELWELFPTILTPHNPQWAIWAKEEMQLLSDILSSYGPIINHIGSTAVKGIHAKPNIDILVELSNGICWNLIKNVMVANGYICMSESDLN